MRWPLMAGMVATGGIVSMVGLASVFGYMGTTPTRTISVSKWNSFTGSYFKGKRGAIFKWADPSRPVIEGDKVTFDERLISITKYLSDGPKNKSACAFNPYGDSSHERIDVSVASAPTSDLTRAIGNPASPSTLYRGVGIRITGADKIKCTKTHVLTGAMTKFLDFELSFDPSNHIDTSKASKCPDEHICFCAIDYFPGIPTDAPAGEINAEAAIASETATNPDLASVNPGVTFYDPTSIADYAHKASTYKMAQITAQIASADKSGCQNSTANKESKKIIPYQIITPSYIQKDLGKSWTKYLMPLVSEQLPNNLQKNSPLAGLSSDEALDEQGLHINY